MAFQYEFADRSSFRSPRQRVAEMCHRDSSSQALNTSPQNRTSRTGRAEVRHTQQMRFWTGADGQTASRIRRYRALPLAWSAIRRRVAARCRPGYQHREARVHGRVERVPRTTSGVPRKVSMRARCPYFASRLSSRAAPTSLRTRRTPRTTRTGCARTAKGRHPASLRYTSGPRRPGSASWRRRRTQPGASTPWRTCNGAPRTRKRVSG